MSWGVICLFRGSFGELGVIWLFRGYFGCLGGLLVS